MYSHTVGDLECFLSKIRYTFHVQAYKTSRELRLDRPSGPDHAPFLQPAHVKVSRNKVSFSGLVHLWALDRFRASDFLVLLKNSIKTALSVLTNEKNKQKQSCVKKETLLFFVPFLCFTSVNQNTKTTFAIGVKKTWFYILKKFKIQCLFTFTAERGYKKN